MNTDLMEELFSLPKVRDAINERLGGEQALRDSAWVMWDTPTEVIVYITEDDQVWYWRKEEGWEEVAFAPDLDWLKEGGNAERHDYLFSFPDPDGEVRHVICERPVKAEALHPRFVEIMAQLHSLPENARYSDQYAALFAEAMHYAPAPLKAEMDAKLKSLGLLPEATHYTEDGQPVFSASQIADALGMTEEEVIQKAQEFATTHESAVVLDATQVYRKH